MKVVDLFCGCGGFSLGFDYLDQEFELIYGLDNWEAACKSYRANFPYVDVDCRDALEVKPSEIPKADIVIGGPPCQDFTIARAKWRGKYTPPPRTFDTKLVEWFLEVIDQLKPQAWIMENVPPVAQFLNSKYKKQIFKMSDYGIPQIRKRLFYGQYNDPEKSPTEIRFPTVLGSEHKGGWDYRPPNLGQRLGAVFRRRCLLVEAKLVQTFPLDFIVYGKLKDQYTQIGNAVPPLMAYRLAEAIAHPMQLKLTT